MKVMFFLIHIYSRKLDFHTLNILNNYMILSELIVNYIARKQN